MAKGDDIERRKKNKSIRKKQNSKRETSSSVSARVASIIASKKRRKTGTRRMCQGMCFSLPTPENPFNELNDKKNFKKEDTKKKLSSKGKSTLRKESVHGDNMEVDSLEKRTIKKLANSNDENKKMDASINKAGKTRQDMSKGTETQLDREIDSHCLQEKTFKSLDCPSKYLMTCLKEIETALRQDGTYSSADDKPLFLTTWGVDFWKCYSAGMDVLEASGSSSDVEQIAWIASTAADSIARREKEGQLFTSPFLLFLVPSKEKAIKVRSICKPLKDLGIHTVSLHPGASIDHQINGLKSCEPEFLVSTPERLSELLSLKAVDISGVSLLVFDGLESHIAAGHLDKLKSIKQCISAKPPTVVFNDCFNNASITGLRKLLMGPVYRLSLNDSIASQSACIVQSIHVCTSEEEKAVQGIRVLNSAYNDKVSHQPMKALYVVKKDSNIQQLVLVLKFNGYSVSASSCFDIPKVKDSLDSKSKLKPTVSLIDAEEISTANLGEYRVVIIPDFVLSIENYVHILTRMARNTVHGTLNSFLTKDDAQYAGPLIQILQQCGQEAPQALRNMSRSC